MQHVLFNCIGILPFASTSNEAVELREVHAGWQSKFNQKTNLDLEDTVGLKSRAEASNRRTRTGGIVIKARFYGSIHEKFLPSTSRIRVEIMNRVQLTGLPDAMRKFPPRLVTS